MKFASALVFTVAAAGCGANPAPAANADRSSASNPFRPAELFALADNIKSAVAGKGDPATIPVALVANHLDPYWTPCQIGTGRAASELGCPSVFQAPVRSSTAAGDLSEQRSIIQELIAEKYRGISLSAVDATMINDLIESAVADDIAFITIDSDAPASVRTLYMGTNNYNAGRRAGEAFATAVGQGKVAALGGIAGAATAKERMRGIKDGIANSALQLVDVVNTIDDETATVAAVAELALHPDLAGFITVNRYEGPAVARVVQAAGKAGAIKIVCFDSSSEVLDYIHDGVISGAVGQRPYFMGYLSVYVLYSISTLGVQATLQLLQPSLGGTNGDVIDTGTDLLTRETIADYSAFQLSLGVNAP
jgi:ribose transport system substrate-binding protein